MRDGVCRYCGEPGWEIEHVNPLCKLGDSTPFNNLVLSCTSCNQAKGSEAGFELGADNRLTWRGELVGPGGLYGRPLMALVERQRLDRQKRQGSPVAAYKEIGVR